MPLKGFLDVYILFHFIVYFYKPSSPASKEILVHKETPSPEAEPESLVQFRSCGGGVVGLPGGGAAVPLCRCELEAGVGVFGVGDPGTLFPHLEEKHEARTEAGELT